MSQSTRSHGGIVPTLALIVLVLALTPIVALVQLLRTIVKSIANRARHRFGSLFAPGDSNWGRSVRLGFHGNAHRGGALRGD